MRFLVCLLFCAASATAADWKQIVKDRMPLYGHRNWIVVADSAYPAQSRDGIETVIADVGQVDVLKEVLAQVSAAKHVRANIFLDRELNFLQDADAPGVEAYRKDLFGILRGVKPAAQLHEDIIKMLDTAAQTFRVLIIKTNMTVPYTSVFLQLDCAYWSAASEKKLRTAMKQ